MLFVYFCLFVKERKKRKEKRRKKKKKKRKGGRRKKKGIKRNDPEDSSVSTFFSFFTACSFSAEIIGGFSSFFFFLFSFPFSSKKTTKQKNKKNGGGWEEEEEEENEETTEKNGNLCLYRNCRSTHSCHSDILMLLVARPTPVSLYNRFVESRKLMVKRLQTSLLRLSHPEVIWSHPAEGQTSLFSFPFLVQFPDFYFILFFIRIASLR